MKRKEPIMKKAVQHFILYAMLAIAVLLTVLLGILNGINFTMAAEDADRITELLAGGNGDFGRADLSDVPEFSFGHPSNENFDGSRLGRFRTMGPSSPELPKTTRYFTVRFDKNQEGKLVAFQISAVSESEAVAWGKSLLNETTGWTHRSYRYRVYARNGSTYVTVIDQSRELLPCYRILLISVIGEITGILISFLVLLYAGKRLFRPIEEADRRQKRFIADAENEFQVPLTVISANTECMEQDFGPSEPTRSIHRQVRKMTGLVRRLGALAIFDDSKQENVNLSALLTDALTRYAERFSQRQIAVESDIAPNAKLSGHTASLASAIEELCENACKYAQSSVLFTLTAENKRIRLTVSNNAALPDGNVEQVFDRFTTLSNATEGSGLGLAHVKDVVKAHNGRVYANVENGRFLIRLDL